MHPYVSPSPWLPSMIQGNSGMSTEIKRYFPVAHISDHGTQRGSMRNALSDAPSGRCRVHIWGRGSQCCSPRRLFSGWVGGHQPGLRDGCLHARLDAVNLCPLLVRGGTSPWPLRGMIVAACLTAGATSLRGTATVRPSGASVAACAATGFPARVTAFTAATRSGFTHYFPFGGRHGPGGVRTGPG